MIGTLAYAHISGNTSRRMIALVLRNGTAFLLWIYKKGYSDDFDGVL